MTRTKLALLALTVSGAFACGDSRNLVGTNNSDGAAGSSGNLAGSGGGSGRVGSGGVASGGVALGSGDHEQRRRTRRRWHDEEWWGDREHWRCGGEHWGGGCRWQGASDAGAKPDVLMSSDAQALAELCAPTGGKVEPLVCCASAGDFPNSCLVGACGCDPTSGHTVTVCARPASTCFLPTTGCVPTGTGGAGGGGGSGGAGGGGGGSVPAPMPTCARSRTSIAPMDT